MKSILAISPTPTHPQDAGNRRRVNRLLDRLQAEGHRVTFVMVGFEKGDREAMREKWEMTHFVSAPYRWKRFAIEVLNAGASVLSPRLALPFRLDDWYPRTLSPWLRHHLADHHYDAVLANYVFLSRALESFGPDTLKILDTHDVFGGRHRVFQEQGLKPRWFFTTEKEEERGFRRADVVLAIQDNEAQMFRKRVPGVEVLTVGFGIDPIPGDSGNESPHPVLAYIGSENRANVLGLEDFISEVFPRLRERFPDLELRVAGDVGLGLGKAPEGCVILGRLPDLRSFYDQAWVVLNTMTFGTGLKIKTLEALAHGKAVVTTPVGADGLEAGRGTAFRVAEDAPQFQKEVTRLIEDRAHRLELGQGAIEYIRVYSRAAESPLLERLEKS